MQPLRIAALGFSHESNSFAPGTTDAHAIQAAGILRGAAIRDRYAGGSATPSGFLEVDGTVVEGRAIHVSPLLYTFPTPGPLLDADAFEAVVGEMLQLLRDRGPWDGVLLGQHGAAVTATYPDADAEVTRRVRALVGPQVPIGLATDMHANLGPGIVAAMDVLVGYRTNPHLDARERAAECGALLARLAATGQRLHQALEQVPIAISIAAQLTRVVPMSGLLDDLARVLATPGVATATITEGYQYADVPDLGMAAYVATWHDEALATDAARWLASRIWAQRDRMVVRSTSVVAAVTRAAASDQRPVLLLDSGDNIGGGSGGDSTAVFAETRRQGLHPSLVILQDPAGVAACDAAGLGSRIAIEVGGRLEVHTPPVLVAGRVRQVASGRFVADGAAHAGMTALDPGQCSVIDTVEGDVVILTSHPVMPVHLEQLRVLGVSLEGMAAVVAKGVQSPRPAYEPACGEVIVVDSPGSTTLALASLPYLRRPRPLFPFEQPAGPEGTPWRPG